MREWYCQTGGNRYGPVREDEFRRWIAEGRVSPDDSVWTEGMPQWQPAGSVPGLFGPGVTATAKGRTLVAAPGGTGGGMGIFEIYSRAWGLMSGRWGVAIGFCLLIYLMGLASMVLWCFGGPFWFLIFLAGPFTLSGAIFFLTYIRGGQVRVGMMWSGFSNYGTSLGAFLLPYLLTLLWSLLGALPGVILGVLLALAARGMGGQGGQEALLGVIVVAQLVTGIGSHIMSWWASIRYSQTMFLLADSPSMGVLNAIRRSIEIMRGHKFRLFGMLFLVWLVIAVTVFLFTMLMGVVVASTRSFAGVILMQILSFVVQVLVTIFAYPFLGACMAVFHDDLAPPAQAAAVQGPMGALPIPTPGTEPSQDVNPQPPADTPEPTDEQA